MSEQTHQTEMAPAAEAGNLVRRPGIKLIARIFGGLGNQLFIYAAGRALAARMGARLELDTISGYANDHLYRREYLLDQFAITAPVAARVDCFAGPFGRWREALMLRFARKRFVDERRIDLTGWIRSNVAPCKLYLRGYWQGEGYFKEYADPIRREYDRRAPLLAETKVELRNILDARQSVALCLRSFREVPAGDRGLVLNSDYYRRSMDRMSARLVSPQFFVFSDDLVWARSQLPHEARVTFMSSKPRNEQAIEELGLLRSCRHFIIGNGTLHWWGAWLADHPDKSVLVPREVAESKPRYYPATWEAV